MISSEPIFSIRCEVANILDLGTAPFGHRRVVNLLGGTVSGARLNGRIVPGGADWQILRRDAFLIEREDEMTCAGVDEEIGILHALGDALVGEQIAEIVLLQEIRKLVGGNVGVDRHAVYSAAASGRTERGSGKNSFSSAAETVSTCRV